MSVEAITWALAQKLDRSSSKFVLVAMANYANADMTCWPSIKSLSDATCQDRKTVLENIKRLKELGLITALEESKGKTNQVPVYALNTQATSAKEQAQKRNSTENGTVPKTEANSPVFPAEQSRFSVETGPKTGHGTVMEPSIEPSVKQKARARKPEVEQSALVEAGFTPEAAADFIEHKRTVKAPLTPRAWADHLAESAKAGWTPQAAAEKVMARGWKGFDAKYGAGEQRSKSAETPYQRSIRERVSRMTGGILGSTPPGQSADIIDITEAAYADARALR